jgi:predicted membrane protein
MSIEIIAEIPSSSKEFENLINCIHSSDFFKKNGYNITLPKINIFRDLYDNPEKIKNTDMGELKKLFVKEEYSRCFFNKSSETIKETISDLKIDMLKRIFILSEN